MDEDGVQLNSYQLYVFGSTLLFPDNRLKIQ